MKRFYFSGKIAEVELYFAFRHEDTYKYFEEWVSPCRICREDAIGVTEEDTQEWVTKWGRKDDPYTEFGLSVFRASDYLLSQGRCVFHAAAIVWKGKAFLFTARSGTGKTTQMRNWLRLYPDESCILNGDKPVLSAEGDRIWVWPSPWKGKERLGDDAMCAPLGGIIFLEQASENQIHKMQPYESAALLLERFLCTVGNEEIIRAMCSLEEKILSSVPVWKLKNTGDQDSTILAHDTLLKELFL